MTATPVTPRVALLLLLLAMAAPARAGEPRLFATWKAPYGQPRATGQLTYACADTSRRDTLFLTYTTGKDSPFFIGLEAQLYMRAASGDSLQDFWKLDGPGANNVMVDFSTDSIPG